MSDRDDLARVIREATTCINESAAADAALAWFRENRECPTLPEGTSPTVLRLAANDLRYGFRLGFGGLPRSLPGTLEALADAIEGHNRVPSGDAGWRPASNHGLPDGTRVEARRRVGGHRWMAYTHGSGYYTTSAANRDMVWAWPDGAEVRPLVPADEAEPEWVPLTAEQAEHVEKGTVVRVEGDGMTVTGPLHRIVSHENDDDVVAYVGSREGSKWLVRGTVSVSPEVAARVIEQADPDADAANALRDASWNVPRLADGSRPDPLPGLPEARDLLTALREAGFDVVRKEER